MVVGEGVEATVVAVILLRCSFQEAVVEAARLVATEAMLTMK